MHLLPWKPILKCAEELMDKKNKNRRRQSGKKASALRQLQELKLREALEEASVNGSLSKSREFDTAEPISSNNSGGGTSPSVARLYTQQEFLRATSLAADRTFATAGSIPGVDESFSKFIAMYPQYQISDRIDVLRKEEYSHLSSPKVCLDYCGFGLFSNLQSFQDWESSAFTLQEITANLRNHVLFGAPERGTAEYDIRARIMDYLNAPEREYGLVFTVSRGSAFKLLANLYPFRKSKNLLTVFDHESQSVDWMACIAKEKGATVRSASFKWPTLKLWSADLREQICRKKKKWRKKDSTAGLFVFPVQSRVTGTKYSYQWMSLAQQNNWHVLLDAGSLGPKDMDSLGLSLFRPDFIITSFYRVFGSDPTGFGCLVIKKAVLGSLLNQNGNTGSGMVRIAPLCSQYLSDSFDGMDGLKRVENMEMKDNEDAMLSDTQRGSQFPVFSGAFTSSQVRDTFETAMVHDSSPDRDGASTMFVETESVSVGEIMKSPVFSEDESSDSSFWIGLGHSPIVAESSGQLKMDKLGSPAPPPWFTGNNYHKKLFPKDRTETSKGALFDDQEIYGDAVVLSVSQERDRVKELPKDPVECNNKDAGFHCTSEIEEEHEINGFHGSFGARFSANGLKPDVSASLFRNACVQENGTSEICQDALQDKKESVVKRDNNEGGLKLLHHRLSYAVEDNKFTEKLSDHSVAGEVSEQNLGDDDHDDDNPEGGDVDEVSEDDDQESGRGEPEIVCRHLDHVDMLGLNKTTSRLRYLVNWLVTSLLQLRLPESNGVNGLPLVQVYGPKIKYERGPFVAFNVRTSAGGLIQPVTVQKLAEKDDIFLGVGFLSHITRAESQKSPHGDVDLGGRVEVVTASLGFLSSFKDTYRMWAFVAKFLDPAFVESDRNSEIDHRNIKIDFKSRIHTYNVKSSRLMPRILFLADHSAYGHWS